MRNTHGKGGVDPDENGTDHPIPANQQEWPPETAFVSAVDVVPDSVADDIASMVREFFPHADVRISADHKRVGLWTTASPTPETSAARDRGLANLTLKPKHNFVLSISPSTILGIGDVVWKRMPKRLDEAGNEVNPDDTKVLLERFGFELVAPNILRLHVHGAVAGPIPETGTWPGFDYTQTDRLQITADERLESKREDSISPDPRWLAIFGGPDSAPGAPNPGAMLVDRLPNQVLISGSQTKLVINYTDVHVSPGTGIRIEMSSAIRLRDPKVAISTQPVTISTESTIAKVKVEARPQDLRNPKVIWHTDGHVEQHGHGATITYALQTPHPIHLTHTVRVEVSDADGGSANAHADVHINSKLDPVDHPNPAHRHDR